MAPSSSGKSRSIIGAMVLACLSAVLAFGFWRYQGKQGLAGAAAGIALGAGMAWAVHRLRQRTRSATGLKVVQGMLLATFSSFAFFIGLSVLLAFAWPEAAAAVVMSALAIYLAVSFAGAVSQA